MMIKILGRQQHITHHTQSQPYEACNMQKTQYTTTQFCNSVIGPFVFFISQFSFGNICVYGFGVSVSV